MHATIAAAVIRIADGIEQIADSVKGTRANLTVSQVAEIARVAEKTVYRWKAEGLLKPMAENVRPLLFDSSEVDGFLCAYRRGRGRTNGKS